jgi:hypothetical protein
MKVYWMDTTTRAFSARDDHDMNSLGPVPERGDATSLVVDLNQLAAASLATVEGKALNLGRLAAADFPVPPGFCLTTVGYRKAAPPEMDDIAGRLDGVENPNGGRGLQDLDRNRLAGRGRGTMAAAPVPHNERDQAPRGEPRRRRSTDGPTLARRACCSPPIR